MTYEHRGAAAIVSLGARHAPPRRARDGRRMAVPPRRACRRAGGGRDAAWRGRAHGAHGVRRPAALEGTRPRVPRARRTPEIGLRIALGASRGDLIGMMLRESAAPVLIGVMLG